jgi:hypothetical protein
MRGERRRGAREEALCLSNLDSDSRAHALRPERRLGGCGALPECERGELRVAPTEENGARVPRVRGVDRASRLPAFFLRGGGARLHGVQEEEEGLKRSRAMARERAEEEH